MFALPLYTYTRLSKTISYYHQPNGAHVSLLAHILVISGIKQNHNRKQTMVLVFCFEHSWGNDLCPIRSRVIKWHNTIILY